MSAHISTVPYRNLTPGIGEAVAKRTILRKKEDGTLETWGDVAERVARGNSMLLRNLPGHTPEIEQFEFAKLRKHIANASLLMSGRHLQHGDETQIERNQEVFTNCFHRDTEVLTLEHGPVSLGSVLGETVTVKARDGKWRPAVVKSYGNQPLNKIKFGPVNNAKSNILIEVIATANHRWFLKNGEVSENLSVGDILEPAATDVEEDEQGIRHGLIFGDGSAHKSRNDYGGRIVSQGRQYCSIRLCGDDKKYLQYFKKYNISYPKHANGDPVVYIGKVDWKDLPFTNDPSYIAGFIKGWWLADGSKTFPNWKGIEISTTQKQAVSWLKKYAPYAGYIITGETVRDGNRKGAYSNGKKLYQLRLSQNKYRKVLEIEKWGEDEVFCVEEPVTQGFVLGNGLLTGNCSTSSSSFLLFYLLLNGSGVGRSYDDDLMIVDWGAYLPHVKCVLDESHKDFNWDIHESVTTAKKKYPDALWHEVADTREGWAKALEYVEYLAYTKNYAKNTVILDFSKVRPSGSPIRGMQNRPASGPAATMKAFQNVASLKGSSLPVWEQTLWVDHYLAESVLVGGARRSARIATKTWTDPDILRFINVKKGGFLWSANNSITVDEDFWLLDTARKESIFESVCQASYYDNTGEPGFINQHKLVQNDTGLEDYTKGDYAGSDKYQVNPATQNFLGDLAKIVQKRKYTQITNPCGEVTLSMLGGYCVIADVVPYFTETDDEAEEAFRVATRALIRVNTMDALYDKETSRTNRIGVGMTGIHEYAWKRFGFGFRDLVDEEKSKPFWEMLSRFKDAVADEAERYSKALGLNVPHTNTTIKPAGTTSKLFALSEGAHLPAMKEYLRWVQFRSDDPLIKEYKEKHYPVRDLKVYAGATIIGFPTQPEICTLEMDDKLVTAGEATPEEQYQWLMLLEKYWIHGVGQSVDTGNQVSYTLKYKPDIVSFEEYKKTIKKYQSRVRCCSVMPQIELSAYEYQPEESISREEYDRLNNLINGGHLEEDIDMETLQCSTGACPI